MANILRIPVSTVAATLVWSARSDTTVNTILLINQDLNNTVYIGQDSTATVNGQNTIPLPPNGSLSVDPNSSWYVIGAAQGIAPLVMVPNGQATFRALTQGEGVLAVPSVRSPNFQLNPLTGWSIDQDGNAYFESVTIGGGVVRVTFSAVQPLNPNTGDVWFDLSNGARPNTFNGTVWNPYQWGQQAIGNNAVGTSQIANAAVTPAQIASLTASLIGNMGGVLNANPYFTGGDSTGWLTAGTANFSVTSNPPAGSPYKYAAQVNAGNGIANKFYDFNEKFLVQPNTQYLVTAWVYSSLPTINIGFDWRNSAGGLLSEPVQSFNVPVNTWSQVTAVLTSPAGAVQANIVMAYPTGSGAGTFYATGLLALPQVPGGLIQAGTITTEQLVTNLIYAGIIDGTVVNAATFNGSTFNGTDFIIAGQGAFFYSGVPANNNLTVSISGSATANDPFGNSVPQGIQVNGAIGSAQLETSTTHPALILVPANMVKETAFANVHVTGNNPGAVNESQTLVVTSGDINNNPDATLQLISAASDNSTPAQAIIDVPIVMDQWTNMTLINGWANNASFVPARYRKVASPPNSVQIQAFISGNAASNGTFFQLPNGYIPANPQGFAIGCTSSTDSTNGRVDTLGNLSIANVVMPAAQTFFVNSVISLD